MQSDSVRPRNLLSHLAFLPLLLLFSAVTSGQEKHSEAKVTYLNDSLSEVSEISNMTGDVKMKCSLKTAPVDVEVAKRDFAEDEVTIIGLVLKDADDERYVVNVNADQLWILGRHQNRVMWDIFKKGNKLRVWINECSGGGSGLFLYLEKVKRLEL